MSWRCPNSRVADPDGVDPDPDPTLEKKNGSGYDCQEKPDPTPEKKPGSNRQENRIRP